MIATTFDWHPHTECPKGNCVSLLLAAPARADDDIPVLLGMFDWVNGELRDSGYGAALPAGPFFWAYENDVVGSLESVGA